MNKKLLILSIATILAAPSAFAADPVVDTQKVNVTVPEINLFTVSDAAVNFDLTSLKPVTAGAGFGTTTANTTTKYAISANNKIDGTGKNKVTVSVDTLPKGGMLTIDMADAGVGSHPEIQLTNGATPVLNAVGLTNLSNVATSDKDISYKFGPEAENGMIEFTGETAQEVTVSYTLTDV